MDSWTRILLIFLVIPFAFIALGITGIIVVKLTEHYDRKTAMIPIWILGVIILMLVLEIPLRHFYKKANSVCRDQKILSLLKNDETTPEFVLDGHYYELPCPLQTFIDNGYTIVWEHATRQLEYDEIIREDGEYVAFNIRTPYGYLFLIVEWSGPENGKIRDMMVVGAFYTSFTKQKELDKSPNPDFFVTKHGITENTSFSLAKELNEGVDPRYTGIKRKKGDNILSSWDCGNYYEIRTQKLNECFDELPTFYSLDKHSIPIGRTDYNIHKEDSSVRMPLSLIGVRAILYAVLSLIFAGIFFLWRRHFHQMKKEA